jgi:hypothetical protein
VTFISLLKELWKRRLLVVLAVVIAGAAAVVAVYEVSLSPPSLSKSSTPEAEGSSEILVDSARSPLAGSKRNVTQLVERAAVFSRLMASGDIVKEIAQESKVPAWEIAVAGPQPFPGEAPGISEASKSLPYELSFAQAGELPIVSITSRAPTPETAKALATAAPAALRRLVQSVQLKQKTPKTEKVEIRVLGPTQVKEINNAPGKKVAAAVFFGVLLVLLALILAIPRLADAWRRADEEEDTLEEVADISDPTPTLVIPNVGAELAEHGRRVGQKR